MNSQPEAPAKAGNAQAVDLRDLITRLESAQRENRQHYRAYTLVRDYRLYRGGDQQPKSDVVAEVSFVPPDNKTFKIQKVSGISRGEKIVRNLLQQEVKAMKDDRGSTLLDRENYDFTYLGTENVDGHSCFVLGLQPKHKRPDVLVGRAWVDQSTYLPRVASGDLAKNPSWWLKKVHVNLDFGDVGGMWLQTGSRAVADVRWLGQYTFTSRAVDYRTSPASSRGE